ncbi:ABC transporter substrate-binding protein [Paenarthrobacter sp. NyZ202]|uniref:ABC transporter substrate-binding protein n=1 Tax=Paenarthrobacter sp. NyZ202 TaxID=3402689 RepID=UPI003CFA3EA8
MKLHRPLLSVAAAVVLALTVSGCGGAATVGQANQAGTEVKELRYQGWSNQVTFPELADDLGYLGDIELKWVGNTTSGPQDIQSAATNQTDFGGAFTGAVTKLIEAGAPVKGVINYYGADQKTFSGYYVKADSPIKGPRDLIGKKIAVNTLGAHHEAVINTYLTKNGLSPDEIKQVQLVPLAPNDTEEAIRRGQVDAGTLGGVLQDRAIEAGGLRSLFNDYELFGTFAGGQIVLRNDFIEKNPTTARAFTTAIAKAIKWATETPREEVIARYTKIIENRGRNESTANLKYWKSTGVPDNGVIKDEDFTRWEAWLNSAGIVKGQLTPSKYYTNEFNELAASATGKKG